jgi:hypothetical protein
MRLTFGGDGPMTALPHLGERFGNLRFLIRDHGSNFTAYFERTSSVRIAH